MSFRTKRPAHGNRINLEKLESRTLFAAGPAVATIDLVNGQIVVLGDHRRGDVITVSLNAGTNQFDVVTDSATESFDVAAVTGGIRVDGQGGDDQITIDPAVTLPATLIGGKRHDTILGGGGDDVMDGGSGNDALDGRDGDDFILGQGGRDSCKGGSGDDDVDGGGGSDSVDGDDGVDRIRGGGGGDSCSGGDGDDDIRGGPGRDRVRGDDGRDSFDDDRDLFEDRGDDDADSGEHLKPGQVPPAVLASFNTNFPGATIREIELEQEGGGQLFKIEFFTDVGLRQKARFTADGGLIPGGDDD